MRKDAVGMFWEDLPKEVIKREPPQRYWEAEGYAPDWEEAESFVMAQPTFSDTELAVFLQGEKQELFWDIEIYPNYFLILFEHVPSGKFIDIALVNSGDTLNDYHRQKLNWIFDNTTVVGFNSNGFDCVIANLALAGCTVAQMKEATDLIIVHEMRREEIYKRFKVKPRSFDSADLIEVAPLQGSLKIYGGRLHTKKMQDLPFKPDTVLTDEQKWIVHKYCANDLAATKELRQCLDEQLKLRCEMSREYGVDLRSKSDAQIAEAVLVSEIKKVMGVKHLQRHVVEIGRVYKYQPPHFLKFNSDLLKHVFDTILKADFTVGNNGGILMPSEVDSLKITINKTNYKMGIGGLHSCENSLANKSENGFTLKDRDVSSYYPMIILNCNLSPEHLGRAFLTVYKQIVDRRLAAKKRKDKVTADSLKICVNGSFGKLGSMYSMLYAPNLMIQVTITGQLSLLMLIERMENAGIEIVSANTDGIVMKIHDSQNDLYESIVKQWELDTGFETEETIYKALYSRDVNNYLAIKDDGFKGKGIFSDTGLQKNPCSQVCVQAAYKVITTGVTLLDAIRECKDIRQFVTVRTVKGGAFKEGYGYLGKSIRWYYAKGEVEPIIYAQSGNKVPKSDGAKPLMELPDALPDDIDYNRYAEEAHGMLCDIGFYPADFPYIPF